MGRRFGLLIAKVPHPEPEGAIDGPPARTEQPSCALDDDEDDEEALDHKKDPGSESSDDDQYNGKDATSDQV